MEIYIIRHTPVEVVSGICYGQSDVDVNETFFDEVLKLKNKMPTQFDAVFSSPLKRCVKLANLFTENLNIDDRLKEMNFGDWEMKSWNNIPRTESQLWMDHFVEISTPNGESFNNVSKRVDEFYSELSQKDYNKVLVVTHAGPIRCFWANILEFPLLNAFKIPIGFGEIFVIDSEYNTILKKG